MSEREQLEQAIIALEAQRATLGDAVIDAALAPLRRKLAALKPQSVIEQRKLVTVLFSDTAGFTATAEKMDPEDVRDIMRAYFDRLTAAIRRYGGIVEKFIGDAVMAVFGVPTAQEGDPENAVRAALAMQRALGELNGDLERQHGIRLGMRIGINTGPVVVSFFGQQGAENFAVVGDTVNLASRLEHAAPVGGILISHNTYQHVRQLFTVQPLEPLRVKGKQEPIQVYLVQEANPRAFRQSNRGIEGIETQMVGREAELGHLQAALQAAVARHEPHVVTITGAAGIGKSRLLDAFLRWVDALPERFLFFKGRADQRTSNLPYALIRDLFAFRFGIQDSDHPAVAQQKLVQGLLAFSGAAGAARAPFIGHLIGFDFSASPDLQGVLNDARQIRDRAFLYATEFFTHAALQLPVVIVLEDLHWADEGSLNMIEYLAREYRHAPLLIVCTTRHALFEQRPAWGSGHANHTRLEPPPLTEAESEQLVAAILHPMPQVPPALLQLVVGRAEGNPFYLEELIRMLIEDGVIVTAGAAWHADMSRLADIRVPPTLTGVLQARIDALPSTERDILQRAAVVGRVFWDDAVDRLSSGGHPTGPIMWQRPATFDPHETNIMLGSIRTLERLTSLRAKGLITWRESSAFAGSQEYSFSNAMLHHVTYESLLKRQRRAYHAQIAAWLIERSGERVGEYAGLIGGHYERAEEPAQAVAWYRQAARQAQNTCAPETAVRYYRKMLDLLPHSMEAAQALRRVEAYEGLGEMLLWQNQFAEAEQEYTAMRAVAEAAGDVLAQARAWYGLAEVQERRGDYRAALESAAHVEELARLASGQIEMVIALLMQGWCQFRLGDTSTALELANQALLLGAELDAQREMARSMNLIGVIHSSQGHYDQADSFMHNALVLHRELGDWLRVSGTLNNLGMNAETQGNYRAAMAHYQHALAIARDISDQEQEMLALGNLGGVRVRLGEYAAGEADLRQALALAETAHAKAPGAYCFLAEACSAQGKTNEALALALHALQTAQEVAEPQYIGAAWRTLGIAAAQDAAKELLANGQLSQYDIVLPPVINSLQAALEHPEACFTESVRLFSATRMHSERARTLLAWAHYALGQGDTAWAEALRQTAHNIFQQLGRLEL